MADQWRVDVDRDLCIASGLCRGTVPELFVAGDDHKTVVTHDTVPSDERILDAAETCPVEAITVTDTATGDVLAPEE